MSNITKAELDMVIQPIHKRLSLVEENNRSLGLQMAEFKGGMDKALIHVKEQIKEAGDRSDRHAVKLEELFIKYSEQLKDAVENGLAEQKHEIEKINDIFEIGGHSDNAFNMKTFMRLLKEERKEAAIKRAETKTYLKRGTIDLVFRILGAIALVAVGGLSAISMWGRSGS